MLAWRAVLAAARTGSFCIAVLPRARMELSPHGKGAPRALPTQGTSSKDSHLFHPLVVNRVSTAILCYVYENDRTIISVLHFYSVRDDKLKVVPPTDPS